jgi:hypothetical protein
LFCKLVGLQNSFNQTSCCWLGSITLGYVLPANT